MLNDTNKGSRACTWFLHMYSPRDDANMYPISAFANFEKFISHLRAFLLPRPVSQNRGQVS